MRNFNDIFRKDVPYDNINKKPKFHYPFRRYSFWKKTYGEGQIDPPPPHSAPHSHFRVKNWCFKKALQIWAYLCENFAFSLLVFYFLVFHYNGFEKWMTYSIFYNRLGFAKISSEIWFVDINEEDIIIWKM